MDSQRLVSSLLLVVAVAFLAIEKTDGVTQIVGESGGPGSFERRLLAADAAKPAATTTKAPDAAAAGSVSAPAAGTDAATAPAAGPDAAAGPDSASSTDASGTTTDGASTGSGDKAAEDKKASAAVGYSAKAFGMTAFVSYALAGIVMI